MMRFRLVRPLVLSLCLSSATPVLANQTPQTGGSPVAPAASQMPTQLPAQPWVSNCRGEASARVCDTVQLLVDTATQREVVRIAFAKQKATGRIGILVKTPLGLRLDTGAMLRLNGETTGSIEGLVYSRCLADGCYAEKPLTPAEVTRIKGARTIDIVLLNLQGGPVAIPITITGLASAIDRL
jgi:invasion protein IalB